MAIKHKRKCENHMTVELFELLFFLYGGRQVVGEVGGVAKYSVLNEHFQGQSIFFDEVNRTITQNLIQ